RHRRPSRPAARRRRLSRRNHEHTRRCPCCTRPWPTRPATRGLFRAWPSDFTRSRRLAIEAFGRRRESRLALRGVHREDEEPLGASTHLAAQGELAGKSLTLASVNRGLHGAPYLDLGALDEQLLGGLENVENSEGQLGCQELGERKSHPAVVDL